MNTIKQQHYEFIPPHKLKSRHIDAGDLDRVIRDSARMREIMMKYVLCVGIAHPQIEGEDPLAFFITRDELVMNPKIVMRSSVKHSSVEGCMTFPGRNHIKKSRFEKILVEYQVIGPMSRPTLDGVFMDQVVFNVKRWVTGREADIFQHEIDHLNGKYCYD